MEPDSPAHRAGLLPDDEIRAIDGEVPRDVIRWQILTDGPEVHLTVDRQGERLEVVVTKADGDLEAAAGRAAAAFQSALGLLRPVSPAWTPQVLQCSALTGAGIDAVWTACQDYRAALGEAGLKQRRAGQAVAWMWDEINETLHARLRDAPELAKRVPALERQVAAGTLTPTAAASRLLDAFFGDGGPETT